MVLKKWADFSSTSQGDTQNGSYEVAHTITGQQENANHTHRKYCLSIEMQEKSQHQVSNTTVVSLNGIFPAIIYKEPQILWFNDPEFLFL